jgi:hypothetical protein
MTEWELFVDHMMFMGSMFVVALLARGLVELGCYVYKKRRRRQQETTLPW